MTTSDGNEFGMMTGDGYAVRRYDGDGWTMRLIHGGLCVEVWVWLPSRFVEFDVTLPWIPTVENVQAAVARLAQQPWATATMLRCCVAMVSEYHGMRLCCGAH